MDQLRTFAGTHRRQRRAATALDWYGGPGGESGPGSRPMHPDWARNRCGISAKWQGCPISSNRWGDWREAPAGRRPSVIIGLEVPRNPPSVMPHAPHWEEGGRSPPRRPHMGRNAMNREWESTRRCSFCRGWNLDKGRATDGRRCYRCRKCGHQWSWGSQGRAPRYSVQRWGFQFHDTGAVSGDERLNT